MGPSKGENKFLHLCKHFLGGAASCEGINLAPPKGCERCDDACPCALEEGCFRREGKEEESPGFCRSGQGGERSDTWSRAPLPRSPLSSFSSTTADGEKQTSKDPHRPQTTNFTFHQLLQLKTNYQPAAIFQHP